MITRNTSYKAIFFYQVVATISQHIEKRSVVFMRGSAIGYLVAVAVPADLGTRNSFLSFNFEANYALPNNQTHRDLTDRFNLNEFREGIGNVTSITSRMNRNIYGRKYFYETILSYLYQFDLKGKSCLLRIICELAAGPISNHNGLLGTLLNIIFLPTSSKSEEIPAEFYKAETQGIKRGCKKYQMQCPRNLLDLISSF